MKDRIPTYANRKKLTFEDDSSVRYATVEYADEPATGDEGTLINKTFGDASWFVTFTHTKASTNHELTNIDGGANIRFVATDDFDSGDTFTLNGSSVTAKTPNGESLTADFFKSGAVVTCYLNSATNTLFFSSSGGGITRSWSEWIATSASSIEFTVPFKPKFIEVMTDMSASGIDYFDVFRTISIFCILNASGIYTKEGMGIRVESGNSSSFNYALKPIASQNISVSISPANVVTITSPYNFWASLVPVYAYA